MSAAATTVPKGWRKLPRRFAWTRTRGEYRAVVQPHPSKPGQLYWYVMDGIGGSVAAGSAATADEAFPAATAALEGQPT